MYEILNPTTARFTKQVAGSKEEFIVLVTAVQEADEQTKVFMLLTRNYDLDQPDEPFIEFQDLIFKHDVDVVESQKPELLPLDLQAEMHLKCDALTIAYRRWLDELGIETGTTPNYRKKEKQFNHNEKRSPFYRFLEALIKFILSLVFISKNTRLRLIIS
ncbi:MULTISPECIES: hypothetical protein [Clostridia]|uniref:hypothetical protein n=1 Tax=Clostridia TaxID=186801 RepID=UPI0018F49430